MFIERSASRIRAMRTLFVLFGLVPSAALCAWAGVRHSGGHRAALELACERVIGLPLEIGSVEHVRPNALRLRNCRLSSAPGTVVLSAPVVDVESSAGELRVSLGTIDCTPELARVLSGLAGEWLRQPLRFPVDCVIDINDFSWRPRGRSAVEGTQPAGLRGAGPRSPGRHGLHIECVAANGSRAVRVRRNADADLEASSDEVRVVVGGLESGAESAIPTGFSSSGPGMSGRLEVHGTVAEQVPVVMVEALAGLGAGSLPFGDEASLSGTIAAVYEGGLSSGSAQARLERVDLAAASLHLPHRISGEAVLAIDRLEWGRGRITVCECHSSVSRGRLGQRLIEACVSVMGCRPGPAYRSFAREEVRHFDDAAWLLRIGPTGVTLQADPGRSASLLRIQGLSILDEPQVQVPLDRLAWLLSPPGATAVPASRATAWLLGLFSLEHSGVAAAPAGATASGGADAIPQNPSEQAVRPLKRSEF